MKCENICGNRESIAPLAAGGEEGVEVEHYCRTGDFSDFLKLIKKSE